MASPPLVPDPSCLHLICLEAEAQLIMIWVTATATEAACPLCQRPSSRVHSRYLRRVADLPWVGWSVQLRLSTRRFFCDNSACPRAIFTERLPTVVRPYGRKTKRLVDLLTSMAFALGGEAGKRLSQQVGVTTSGDALLQQICVTAAPQSPTPRVLGVDEFSFRRGQVFGTLLVDLERRTPIDLLPDREVETLAAWLRAHPGVQIISRDRRGSYAQGARLGAPEALQVADRFHLLENLRDALERFFLRHRRILRALFPPPTPREVGPEVLTRLAPQEAASQQRSEHFRERFEQVQDLANKRVSPTEIAQRLGVSRQTIYKYLAMDSPPGRKGSRIAAFDLLAPYRPYLLRRWNEGIRNGQQLWREVVSQGYRHSRRSVERFIGQVRRETGQPFKFRQVAPAALYDEGKPETTLSTVTALRAARLFLSEEEEHTPKERTLPEYRRRADPAIEQTYQITSAFCQMLRTRQGVCLDAWITQAKDSDIPELRAFAKYRLSLVHSECSFQLLDRVGPLDRLGRLITVSDERQHCLLEIRWTGEMIGRKELALQHAEPDFELIQPGSTRRQPMCLERHSPLLLKRLLLQPALHLLGRVRRAVIQHQRDPLDTAPPRLGHQHLLEKGLKAYKPFPARTLPNHLPISDAQARQQVQRPASAVAWRLAERAAALGRSWGLFGLAGLDRGFLVHTDDPDTRLQQGLRRRIQLQDGPRSFQKAMRVLDMLPHPIAPGTNPFSAQPAAYGAGRDGGQARCGRYPPSQFRPTPARERHGLLAWQATGDGSHLGAHLRGKNGGARLSAGHRQECGSGPSAAAICGPCGRWFPPFGPVVDCSSWDGHEPAPQSGRVQPAPGRWYAPESADAGARLPPRLIRLAYSAWVLSSWLPPKPGLYALNASLSSSERICDSLY